MPAALWDNKITVWSNRKLLLLAVSKRQNVVSLLSETQAVQIHIELATNCWIHIHWWTATGCFHTEVQTKWILAWGAWRQLDVYCLPLGLWRVTCYTVFKPFQIYMLPNDTNVTCCWKIPCSFMALTALLSQPQGSTPAGPHPEPDQWCVRGPATGRRRSPSLLMSFLPLPFPATQRSCGRLAEG